jgi:hypothetical protein
MKNCQWLKPERIAQIEFREWTPDGHLRHCSFIGLRDDKKPDSVVRAKRLLDYLVGPHQHFLRNRHADLLRGIEIDHQFELGRLLNR